MNTTTKTLTTTLLLFITTGLMAQEKYEYAIVSYYPNIYRVCTSINGETFETADFTKKDTKGFGDLNLLLKKVNELIAKDWEVFSTDYGDFAYVYHLRKKKI